MAVKRAVTSTSIANSFKMSVGQSSAAIPDAPTIGTATVSVLSATVTYTAATLGATASSFTATSSPGSLTGTGSSPITISGLTAETNYTFTVTATNANGTSAASSVSNQITTANVPNAPTIGTATATGTTTATVTFTAPANNGGSAVTSYVATSSPAGGTGTLSQAGSGTINITGLNDFTNYTFTVTATNAVGTSSASAASNQITTPSANHTGATWTSFSLPRSQNWTAIRSNGSRFVAVANGSIYAATSTDGTNWTETTLPLGLGNANVAWNGTIWLALAYNQAGEAGSIATSPDGITWTSRTKPSDYGATHALAAKGSTFSNQGTNQGRTWITTNGINFTTGSSSGFGWWGMTANSSVYVATTYYGNTAYGVSTDGLSYTNYNAPTGQDNFDIVWNGSLFASPCYNSSRVQTSPDGQTWTNRTLPSSNNWSGIASAGANLVTIATNSSSVATSPDGITWTARTLPSVGNVQDTCIASLNGVFVAVSYGSATAYRSTS